MLPRILIALALVVILGVPFAMSAGRGGSTLPPDAPTLVVTTPHVQQIRYEFGHAFSDWHERHYGTPVRVDFRTPGGTSEIIEGLEAQVRAAFQRSENYSPIRNNAGEVTGAVLKRGTVDTDLLFGGGSYDHNVRLKESGVRLSLVIEGEPIDFAAPLSAPADLGFDTPAEAEAYLDRVLGENAIGPKKLRDPDRYWIGTALSTFGIVYNSDVFENRLDGIDPPDDWRDLADPVFEGWVALADPRQSGSLTTTFDSILGNLGWVEGWDVLRAMCGNARYFTASSTKPPTDVSQGEAALGLAIDFYGRGQAQTAGRGRVGYIEPPDAVLVDADPVSVIAGGPNPEIANRFVQFCLTEEAQAIWQFHPTNTPEGAGNPTNPETGEPLGPERYALRRMPIVRAMYADHFGSMIDKVDPFAIVSDNKEPGWRTGIQVMMGCFAIDSHEECVEAWRALIRARADHGFPPAALDLMESAFFAWPDTPVNADGAFVTEGVDRMLAWSEENFRPVRNSWRPPGAQKEAEIYYTRYFQTMYHEVVRIGRDPAVADGLDLETLRERAARNAGLRTPALAGSGS